MTHYRKQSAGMPHFLLNKARAGIVVMMLCGIDRTSRGTPTRPPGFPDLPLTNGTVIALVVLVFQGHPLRATGAGECPGVILYDETGVRLLDGQRRRERRSGKLKTLARRSECLTNSRWPSEFNQTKSSSRRPRQARGKTGRKRLAHLKKQSNSIKLAATKVVKSSDGPR